MPILRPILLLALLCWHGAAYAESDRLGLALTNFLESRSATLPGKVSINLGKYPRSEKLLACQSWQISLPQGSRPWGRISVHARCLSGASQSLYVSAEIRVHGQMLQAARYIAPGSLLSEADFISVDAEISKQPADILLTPDEALGQTSRLAILTGRPLQRQHLRKELAILAGQNVKLILRSASISVSNTGTAINNAALGQPVRVRLASGKIVRGLAREQGEIDLQP